MKTTLISVAAAAVAALVLFAILDSQNPAVSPGGTNATTTSPGAGERLVSVYFLKTGASEKDCRAVFALPRQVDDTPALGREALTALTAGPTDAEKSQGYYTSVNPDAKIISLIIEDGIATVNFNSALEKNSGGSCRAASIRAQITATLQQFPNVQAVVISVEGKTDEALQP